jgi:hypothetical protein
LKTRLLNLLYIAIICLAAEPAKAQFSSASDYYYNYFNGVTTSNSNIDDWTYSDVTGTIKTIDLLSANSMNGSANYLGSQKKTSPTTATNSLSKSLITNNSDLSGAEWEWSILYRDRATAGTNPTYSGTNAVSAVNGWRYWIMANNTNPAAITEGFYITHKSNGALAFYYYKSGTATQYGSDYATTNGKTYNIKVQRLFDNNGAQIVWRFFVDDYSINPEAFTQRGADVTKNKGDATFIYNTSVLECSSNSANDDTFQWDDIKMYTRKITINQFATPANNIGAPNIYTTETLNLFGFSLSPRGIFLIKEINFNSTGSSNGVFGSSRLYRSTDAYFDGGTPDINTNGSIAYNSNGGNNYVTVTGLNETLYGSGNSDGTINIQNYYYLNATVNTANSYTFSYSFSNSAVPSHGFIYGDKNNMLGSISAVTPAATASPTFTTGKVYDWVGNSGVNYNWNTPNNWSTGVIPGTNDVARIGANANFIQPPVVTSPATVGSIILGTNATAASGITVNSTLTVNGYITYQSDTHSYQTFVGSLYLSGSSGTVTASAINIIANTTLAGFPYIETLNSSVGSLTVGSLNLISSKVSSDAFDAKINITAGLVKVTGLVSTANTAGSTSTINVSNSTLQLSGAAALSGLSTLGTNTLSFKNTGATIEYSGTAQTVYTDAAITGLATGPSYQNIKFSGTGIKLPNSGTLNVAGNFTNSLTTNDASNYISLLTTPVVFNGASAQSLYGGSGTGTTFNTVTFNSNGTKTMQSGIFNVAATGTLNMAGTTTLAANGFLTLKSAATGTARVPLVPSTAKITGDVTVERWFTGGALANRGWRLMSSPVNNTPLAPLAASQTSTTSATYNFTSLKTNLPITGSGTGFDTPSGYTANGPTILLYNTSTSLFTLPSSPSNTNAAGAGFYFYYRGSNANIIDKLVKSVSTGFFTAPETNVVGLQKGTLNQQGFKFPLTYVSTATASNYNLVGNPYPSTITIGSGALTGTTNFIYTYSPGGNSVTTQPGATDIVSGQGFFVKTVAPIPATPASYITFTENLKTSTQVTGANLLMGAPVGTEEPLISLKMVQDSANYDIAHVRFLDTYKPTFDELEDAEDMNGQGQSVFFGAMTSDNHEVAIASQPLEKNKTSVFLSVNDNKSGTFYIEKTAFKGIPAVYDVWMMDHFTKDSLDLRANNKYTFNLDKNNAATYGNTRFELVIRKKSLPPYQLISFKGTKSGASISLNWNTLNEYDYTTFELQKSTDGVTFDAVKNIHSSSQGSYNFKDIYAINSTAPVYYRLKQIDINEAISYSNVVVITTTGSGTFNVFPNPATNSIQFSLSEPVKSQVRLNIFNAMGILMKSSNFTSATGQQDVSSLLPGSYTIEMTDLGSKKLILTGKFIKI